DEGARHYRRSPMTCNRIPDLRRLFSPILANLTSEAKPGGSSKRRRNSHFLEAKPSVSELGADNAAVVAAGQVAQGGDVAAFAEEAYRAVAEDKESAAGVSAAERLRRRPVDPRADVIHPPHHVADVDRPAAQSRHADPQSRPLVGPAVEHALA